MTEWIYCEKCNIWFHGVEPSCPQCVARKRIEDLRVYIRRVQTLQKRYEEYPDQEAWTSKQIAESISNALDIGRPVTAPVRR